MEQESKIFKFIDKVKTPLSVSGLALMIMYLVIKAVLNLNIYEKIGSDNTFKVVNKIINYVFIVAIVSLILGVVSYVIIKFKKKKGKPEIIDASIDNRVSNIVLQQIKEKDSELQYYPKFIEVLDLKFINNGDGTAFITKVEIEIITSKLDNAPNLTLHYDIRNKEIIIYATNLGWGSAIIKEAIVQNSFLSTFQKQENSNQVNILSGKQERILNLTPQNAQAERLEFLRLQLPKRNNFILSVIKSFQVKDCSILSNPDIEHYLSKHEKWHVNEFFNDLKRGWERRLEWHIEYFKNPLFDGLPINEPINIELKILDENGYEYMKKFNVQEPSREGGTLWWTKNGFVYEEFEVMYQMRPPHDIYVVFLKPEMINQKKSYPLSHFIKSGDVERLHFLLATEKTADYMIRFIFHFNKGQSFKSETFNLSLYSENRSDFFTDIKDGQHLNIEDGKLAIS